MAGDKAFLGTGWAFPPGFNRTGVIMVDAEQDIHESIRILLSTKPGERIMQPAYGCDLQSQVFENLNSGFVAIMKDLIYKAILFYEPRVIVKIEDITISDKNVSDGKIDINIPYTIRVTNNRYNLVYPFYFNEATNAQK